VGQTARTFAKRYKGGWASNTKSTVLKQALAKYGKENFAVMILEECERSNLNSREDFWAKELNSYAPNGYNLRHCGEAPVELVPRSAEFRKKVGDSKRGLKYSAERKAKVSKPVFCLTNNLSYPSVIEAARRLQIRQGHISEHLHGKRPHVKGFTFRWLNLEKNQ
jgi:hypothetical protein